MSTHRTLALGLVGMLMGSCGGQQTNTGTPAVAATMNTTPTTTIPTAVAPAGARTFEADLAFLRQHGEVHVLTAPNGARVAVSPKYQGRVMTSAVGDNEPSLGWIHRSFIEEGKTGTQFDNYGGEDRFWLGPEGGQFGLYFPARKPFTFEHWQTPAAFQEGAWDVAEKDDGRIVFRRAMEVTNYTGTVFKLDVQRVVAFVDADQVEGFLGAPLGGMRFVAYETQNEVTNVSDRPWTRDGGLLSIWILAMYPPSPDTVVVVPFSAGAEGPLINDAYFGKVPADRLYVDKDAGVALFRCDGEHRSKIGVPPARTKSVLGSYSASARMLTIVQFNGPMPNAPYVNSMWEHQKEPFGGDVVNSYNDGPTEPGKPALGGFYEIETSSAGLELSPGQRLQHVHRTFHIVGSEVQLDAIAKAQLGVSLGYVREHMR